MFGGGMFVMSVVG